MEGTTLCCSCLCAGRRMVVIDEYLQKQCFFKIISEISMPLLKNELKLCWECGALLDRFTRFRQQVKECYKLLHDYADKNLDLLGLQRPPKLGIRNTFNITIHPEIDTGANNHSDLVKGYAVSIDIIKTEQDSLLGSPIKHEDNVSNYSDNINDEAPLEQLKVKKKKKKLTKERKGKKKEVELIREIDLSAEELEEERRMWSNKEEYVNAMFRCEKCIVSFPNADDLEDHLNIKHDPNKSNYKCTICECTFVTEMSFNYHSNKHRRRYECSACGERVRSKGAANKHYATTHRPSTELNSNASGPHENGQANMTQESTESTIQETFPCDFCEKTFRWKTSLRKHIETHRIETGQKRKPYCEPCRLSFTTTSNLQKHVKTSSKHQIQLKLWKLKESLPADAAAPDVRVVARAVNSARAAHACRTCGRRFQWRGNLARHALSHAARANGELVCEPCNRTFSSIATYKQHMKISKKHVTENDFKYMCSECGKRFANKTRLKDHVDWEHLKNFVHTCDVCQKVLCPTHQVIFKSHTSLYLHKQVVHKKDNAEHLCDHCGKHFPNKAKLRSHIIALHSSTAPYKCSVCCARFSWHSCLSRHARRVHRNPDPPGTQGTPA